jgi:hypothetical protein
MLFVVPVFVFRVLSGVCAAVETPETLQNRKQHPQEEREAGDRADRLPVCRTTRWHRTVDVAATQLLCRVDLGWEILLRPRKGVVTRAVPMGMTEGPVSEVDDEDASGAPAARHSPGHILYDATSTRCTQTGI